VKVLVSVPHVGCIKPHVVASLLEIQADYRHDGTIVMPRNRPYENNLHHIVNKFMQGDEEYWLNIDSDNPPINNPLDLIQYDLDIVGLPTPVWKNNSIDLNVYKYEPLNNSLNQWPEGIDLVEVDAIGTGCFLISRRVFENEEMRKAPFQRIYNEDGTVRLGNDIAFSEKAKNNGFKIHVHFGYPCRHFQEVELAEVADVIYQRDKSSLVEDKTTEHSKSLSGSGAI
jgi:hypothetical protein